MFGGGTENAFGFGVDVGEAPVGVEGVEGVADAGEGGGEFLGEFFGFAVEAFGFVDVACGAVPFDEFAVGVVDGVSAALKPAVFTGSGANADEALVGRGVG